MSLAIDVPGNSSGVPALLSSDGVALAQPSAAVRTSADDIAVISHELRNSLSVVRNAARLLHAQFGADGVERARILIERHVGQMSRHIEDLFDTSQGGARNEVLQLCYVDLRIILGNSIEAIAPEIARRGHRLAVNSPADALWAHADPVRLEQVFSNLLINAVKYTPDGGEITVNMERRGKHASIRIRDTGVGIAPAQLSRIFEMYVQTEATTLLAEGGLGIGLAVVRDLVELHGGTVGAASAGLAAGSEFTVLLPALWEL